MSFGNIVNNRLELIDWAQLRDLSGGDADFEQELLQIYLQDSLQQLQILKQAATAIDLPRVREIAHHIKGASANVGAVSVSAAAAMVENAAKESKPDEIATPLSQLSQQLDALQGEMEQHF